MSGRERFETQVVPPRMSAGVEVAELIGLADEAGTALVIDRAEGGVTVRRARTVVDLHGTHIGCSVLLAHENGDPQRPIVVGVLRAGSSLPGQPPGRVDLESDGERLVVTAREQLVLRCGKASITLTRAGKVLIEGAYVLSRASGVNRVKGGSVQIN